MRSGIRSSTRSETANTSLRRWLTRTTIQFSDLRLEIRSSTRFTSRTARAAVGSLFPARLESVSGVPFSAGGRWSLHAQTGLLQEHGFHFAPELGCFAPDGCHVPPGQRLVFGHRARQLHAMGEPDWEPLQRERIGC